jgi:hypothetical protein
MCTQLGRRETMVAGQQMKSSPTNAVDVNALMYDIKTPSQQCLLKGILLSELPPQSNPVLFYDKKGKLDLHKYVPGLMNQLDTKTNAKMTIEATNFLSEFLGSNAKKTKQSYVKTNVRKL